MMSTITQLTKQAQHMLQVSTRGQGLYEITNEACQWVNSLSLASGMLTVFCRHTSASLTIQENADPDVQHDIDTFFARLVREDPGLYRHTCEGPDDMPAHIRSALTDCSLSIPILNNRPALGTWQGIYLFEHRTRAHQRQVVLHAMG